MATVSLGSSAGKWIMAGTILASSISFIDGTALNVVLPSLQRDLHATGPDLFWILNAYLLILASLMLVGGSLGDKLGRKKVFMVGILIFIAGSSACGFAPSVAFLVAFRAVQGMGGALMIPGSLSLISASINEKEKGKAIGTWSAATVVVTMGGPILGGALADAGLWRFVFFINIPIGIASLLILWLRVPESREKDHDPTLDFPGVFTTALGLACLTFGFLRIPTAGFYSWPVIASLAAGLGLLVSFVFIEGRSKHPMMPLYLFANKAFSGTNLLSFFLYAGLAAGMLFLSLDLVQAQGYDQLQSGLTFLPFTLVMIALARFAGTLADRFGPRLFLILGPAVTGVGLLLLSLVGQTKGPGGFWTTFFPGILVFGLGMSFTVAPLTATVMGSVSDQHAGVASGVNNAMTRIANVFANAIFGALAVLFFSGILRAKLGALPLDAATRDAALKQVVNLGEAKAPAGMNQAAIGQAYREAFIIVYQRVMRIASGLALVGSLMAVLFIKKRPHHNPKER